MKKRYIVFALVAVCALCALCACSTSTSGSANLGNDGTAEYKNDTITITLAGNETTGYAWTYSIDKGSVECTTDEYKAESSSVATTGAPGTQTYVFKVSGATEGKITFTYARSWETNDDDTTCSIEFSSDSSGKVTSLTAIS